MGDRPAILTHTVFLPSGAPFEVLTLDEADQVETRSASYMEKFTFVNPSDISDLDQIITGELLVWRWDTWMSRGADWDNAFIDVRHYVDAAKKKQTEVRQLKDQLGIDKKTRDRTSGDGSLPEFIERVLTAARQTDIHRVHQLDKGIELSQDLRKLVTTYRNSDAEERRMTRTTAEDIVEWVVEVFDPEFQAIDDYFQLHVHSTWAGKL